MTIQRAFKGKKDFMQKINDFVLSGDLNGAKILPILAIIQ